MARRVIETEITKEELQGLMSTVIGSIVKSTSITLDLTGIKKNLNTQFGITASLEELAETFVTILKEYLESNNPNVRNVGFDKNGLQLPSNKFELTFTLVAEDLKLNRKK